MRAITWNGQKTRHVSRVIREAGFQKAGRYTSFGGYDPPGFIVQNRMGFDRMTGTGHPDYVPVGATVMFGGMFRQTEHHPAIVQEVAEAIRKAGYEVEVTGRDGHTIEVTS